MGQIISSAFSLCGWTPKDEEAERTLSRYTWLLDHDVHHLDPPPIFTSHPTRRIREESIVSIDPERSWQDPPFQDAPAPPRRYNPWEAPSYRPTASPSTFIVSTRDPTTRPSNRYSMGISLSSFPDREENERTPLVSKLINPHLGSDSRTCHPNEGKKKAQVTSTPFPSSSGPTTCATHRSFDLSERRPSSSSSAHPGFPSSLKMESKKKEKQPLRTLPVGSSSCMENPMSSSIRPVIQSSLVDRGYLTILSDIKEMKIKMMTREEGECEAEWYRRLAWSHRRCLRDHKQAIQYLEHHNPSFVGIKLGLIIEKHRKFIKISKERNEQYSRLAAQLFFSKNNNNTSPWMVDLHGLYVPEALEKVKEFVKKAKEGQQLRVVFIVGRGNHSRKGIPKLRPAVTEWLVSEKKKHTVDFPRVGCITVWVTQTTDASLKKHQESRRITKKRKSKLKKVTSKAAKRHAIAI